MKAYVFYGRVSTQIQTEGYSLTAQRDAAERYVKSLPFAAQIVAFFQEAESGKVNNRPELAKALALAKTLGAILILARLDRLSRNASFLLQLMEAGTEFVCLDCLGLDRFSISILALVAQKERENISIRTKQGLAVARLTKRLGSPKIAEARKIALSRIQERKRAFSETSIKAIREIQSTNPNLSLNRIAEFMTKRGEPLSRGKGKWTATAVKRVLATAKD